jgi:Tfp pilus assembly protein PilN
MNAINLLPAKHRPRRPTGGQQGSAYVVVGILGGLLVMVLLYVLTVNAINSRKTQVATANAETAAAQSRASALAPYGDFSKVKDQRVQSVRQLATGRIDWERLARGLARVLPNDVWLTSASASATGTPAAAGSTGSSPPPSSSSTPGGATGTGTPTVELVGCAPSQAAVAVTLVRLRELAGAQNVQLNEIIRQDQSASGSSAASGSGDCGTIHGKPASRWDATVTFNQTAGTSSTGVSKSLGGGA